MLAIVIAVKKHHAYLHNNRFTIVTDHKPLNYILNTKEPAGKETRWVLLLQAYDYDVEYKPGKLNNNADALSQREYSNANQSDNNEIFLFSLNNHNSTREELDVNPKSQDKLSIDVKQMESIVNEDST